MKDPLALWEEWKDGKEGICLCGEEMEFLGGGRYWCPECGRHCQLYVWVPPVWKEPYMVLKKEKEKE